MSQIPGVHIETLHHPTRYTTMQLDRAAAVAYSLARGKLILAEPPKR